MWKTSILFHLQIKRAAILLSQILFGFDCSDDQMLSAVWSETGDLKVDYLFFYGLLLKIR